MTPHFAMDNAANMAAVKPESSSYLGMAHSLTGKRKNFENLSFGHFCATGLFSSCRVLSMLLAHVGKIFLVRSKPQMGRVHTRWIITAVAHKNSIRRENVPIMQHPTGNMRVDDSNSARPKLGAEVRGPLAPGV